mmetsp:Transcript_6120/g.13185  ORF Transcript_6120/g.13185 Transcript_6120/m.13185 type:complete len:81 (+) Transcript_6120:395-637(+)
MQHPWSHGLSSPPSFLKRSEISTPLSSAGGVYENKTLPSCGRGGAILSRSEDGISKRWMYFSGSLLSSEYMYYPASTKPL